MFPESFILILKFSAISIEIKRFQLMNPYLYNIRISCSSIPNISKKNKIFRVPRYD